MIGPEPHALLSDAILFVSTKGKGQFFTAEQLYHELGVAARSPPMTLEEFRALLKGLAARNLLRRWKAAPVGDQGEVFAGV